MQKFVKKPVVVEAYQFDGNIRSIDNFPISEVGKFKVSSENGQYYLIIPTLEGDMKAVAGDWIIKGVKGEYYPCKPDIFERIYNAVEDNNGILSEGEKRVRTTFNVLSLATVDIAKQLMAETINLLSRDQNDVASYYHDSINTTQYRELSADYQREVATAKTKIEEAAMWTVKALTNNIHVAPKTEKNIPPHQERVINELKELELKITNLTSFITSSTIYPTLDVKEQALLSNQKDKMIEYSNILKERILSFAHE